MWTTTVPHSALMAPDEYVQHYVDKFGDEEPVYTGKGYFPCRYPKATFAAMITYFDRQVGMLIDELKRLGIYDDTIIMFTSDNGPTHNSYTNTLWFDCAHPFRSDRGWVKRSLHEGGIRMPFIVSWGDRLKPSVSDYMGYFPDVMPTLCEIAGVDSPGNRRYLVRADARRSQAAAARVSLLGVPAVPQGARLALDSYRTVERSGTERSRRKYEDGVVRPLDRQPRGTQCRCEPSRNCG